MKRPPRPRDAIDKARRLRRDATHPEAILWGVLRSGHLGGLKFRRQHAIGSYVADFFCNSARLVVEVDGMSHDDRAEYDKRRSEFLQGFGLKVIRVTNDDILDDLEAVARYIAREAGIEIA